MPLNDIAAQQLDLTRIIVPPRSRLHCLAPIGVGTGMVESLTGFTSRLAAAHDVTLATLFGWEIAPLLDKEHLRRSESRSNKSAVLASSFRPMERAVNGTGATARSFAEALERLTMRGGLSYLTLLTWKDVISHRHLIKPTRAWCPACYEEWRLKDNIIYEPLLWSIEAVSSCPSHKRRLRERCHLCQHSLHLLASHARPGYCSVCKGWLGETQFTSLSQEEALDENELDWQRMAVKQVGELISAAPALLDHPRKAVIAKSITRCIEASPFKNENEFARNLKIPQPTLNDWRIGNHVPQLDRILRVCFIAGASLLDFIFGRLPEVHTPQPPLSNEAVKQRIRSRPRLPRRWTEAEYKKARGALEAALVESPPPSMVEIARRLDRSASTLQMRFTELCRKIIACHEEYRKECQLQLWNRVQLSLEAGIRAESPPSTQEVACRLKCSKTVLVQHFPELCEELSKLYRKRRSAYWKRIETALKDSLEGLPPQSMRAIAKDLGCSHTSIRNYFPDLCRQLATRYAQHRSEQSQCKQEQLRLEVRETALAMCEEGNYPTVRRVSQCLAQPRYLRSSKVGLAALREVRREINKRSESNVRGSKRMRNRS